MRHLLIAIPLLLLAALPGLSLGAKPPTKDLVVIVNPASGVTALQPGDVVNIFMGRYRKLPSGIVAFPIDRSEEHTSELQSLMRISSAVFCLKKKKTRQANKTTYMFKSTFYIQ